MIQSVDQLGNRIALARPPQRIVSLVPSQTELLFDLGLSEQVIGRTRYCIHPAASVTGVAEVGGTKQFSFERIDALAPDLIIGNREENYREGIRQLQQRYPVWLSDISDLGGALQMIRELGRLVGRGAAARALATEIEQGFAELASLPLPHGNPRVAYLIWRKPYMVAGGGNFIHDLLQRAGLRNVFAHEPRYPAVSASRLRDAAPDALLLSSEPFPFSDAHHAELGRLVPEARVLAVDGALLSWYGSRLRQTPAYLHQLVERLATGD